MPKDKAKLFSIVAKAEANTDYGELLIYGDISESNYWGDGDVIPEDVDKAIKQLANCKEIAIRINSYGGSVFAGQAMVSMISRLKAKTTAYVDGIAASMGSAIAMAADKVVMPKNAVMMIHKPSGSAYGNADELRKEAELLDTIEKTLVSLYMKRFKGTEEELIALLAAETWLTGEEAFENGLCDEVEEPIEIAASAKGLIINKLDISKNTEIYSAIKAKGAIPTMDIKAELGKFGVMVEDTDTKEIVLDKLAEVWDKIIKPQEPTPTTTDGGVTPTSTEPTPTPEPTPVPATPTEPTTAQKQQVSAEADPAIVAKAEKYDALHKSVVDKAIADGIKASGEKFDEERWRKIFDNFSIDEITAQATEWAGKAADVLHAGVHASQVEDTNTENSEIVDLSEYKL